MKSDESPRLKPRDPLSFDIFKKESSKEDKNTSWEGAIVAVVGLYDKGKTFV